MDQAEQPRKGKRKIWVWFVVGVLAVAGFLDREQIITILKLGVAVKNTPPSGD